MKTWATPFYQPGCNDQASQSKYDEFFSGLKLSEAPEIALNCNTELHDYLELNVTYEAKNIQNQEGALILYTLKKKIKSNSA